jgi:hypothetical protein
MAKSIQVSVELPAGIYYFGDICYALPENVYDQFWGEKCKYSDGAWDVSSGARLDKVIRSHKKKPPVEASTTSRNAIDDIGDVGDFPKPKASHHKVFAVGQTAHGDGRYPGLQKEYPVDAGVLGVVSADLIDPEKKKQAKKLGLIFTSKTPIHFISDGEGYFEVDDGEENIEEDTNDMDVGDYGYDENTTKRISMKLTEGRKSNILKILSQLHAYLKRYQDLDKTESISSNGLKTRAVPTCMLLSMMFLTSLRQQSRKIRRVCSIVSIRPTSPRRRRRTLLPMKKSKKL